MAIFKVKQADGTWAYVNSVGEVDTSSFDSKIALKGDNLEVDADTNLLYLTSNGERISEGIHVPSGGSGGGGGVNLEYTISLTNLLEFRVISVASGSPVILKFNYTSVDSEGLNDGAGVGKLTVDGITKHSFSVVQGENTLDITSFLNSGENTVRVRVENSEASSKTLSYTVSVISATITSTFDNSSPFTSDVTFPFITYGNVEKTVHYKLDGTELGTLVVTTSGRQSSVTIPASKLSHGAHYIEVYFTCTVEGTAITSNTLYYEFMYVVSGNNTPIIIAKECPREVNQYDTVLIKWMAYTPNSLTTNVVKKVNGDIVGEVSVDRTEQVWSYRADTITPPPLDGSISLSLVSGDVNKEIWFHVTARTIDVEQTTDDMVLYLSSYGRTNTEANPATWQYNSVSSVFSGFNFASDGWQLDEEDVTVLRLSGDARLTIPINMFASDARNTGKTIEIEFATRDVMNYDAVIMSCMSGGRGLQFTAQKASLIFGQSEIGTQYKENEHVRLSFVIEKSNENRLMLCYINGILSGAMQYPTTEDFIQASPVGISVGSNDCGIDLYCIRVYDNNLTRYQILDNWIYDTQVGSEKLDRYTRNNIYNEYGEVVIKNLPADLPYLIIEGAELPQYKGDKKTVSGSYTDLMNPSKSFTFEGAQIDVQGTSSQFYARKNYKVKFNNGLTVNGVASNTYAMRDDSIPTDTFTFKADVASSEGANNVELARLYNDICPYKTPPQIADSRVRQGIDGFPIVVFWNNGSTTTFIGKYNFNNDKGTEEVFGFANGDESWEVRNNTSDRVLFKSVDFSGTGWLKDFESRYPEDYTDSTKLFAFASWVNSTDQEGATGRQLSPTVIYDGVTYEHDTQEYRLAKFKAELANHASVDAMLFNYIFTEMFLMVDNRAKNAFFTEFDADGGKWIILPYDYDTAIGINNEGSLAFGYELEDIDKTASGANVFNGQDSVLFVNLRQAFYDEITAMYQELRSTGLVSYDVVENRFEEHQAKWSESIFNEDAYFKYLEPLLSDGNASYLSMLQGSKAEQRKWWLYNRFRYLDSKYKAGDCLTDYITLRGYAKSDITITPYADIYANVNFANSYYLQTRALRGNSYVIKCPLDTVNDTEIYIYSASQISGVGDLSGLSVGYADFSMATRLQSLKLGDASAEYSNSNLNTLYLGNNTLLKTIDVRNCPALGTGVQKIIDLTGCSSISEIYFDGTSIAGVLLPDGGIVNVLHLPATTTTLILTNQNNISDLTIEGYNNLATLRIEGCSGINSYNIAKYATNLNRVRLTNVNWTVDDLSVLDRIGNCGGIDENGKSIDTPVFTGKCVVTAACSEGSASAYRTMFPNVEFTFSNIGYLVTFKNYDGTVLKTQNVASGGDANPPKSPTREGNEQYYYTFVGWDISYKNVTADIVCTAEYAQNICKYTVRFYNGDTLVQTSSVEYGSSAVYSGGELTKVHSDPNNYFYMFSGWSPDISNITGDLDTYAQFVEVAVPSFSKANLPSGNVGFILEANEHYLLVDTTSKVAYHTTDFSNYNALDLSFTSPLVAHYGFGYANGFYFLCFNNTTLYHSSDCITWTSVTANMQVGRVFAYHNGYYYSAYEKYIRRFSESNFSTIENFVTSDYSFSMKHPILYDSGSQRYVCCNPNNNYIQFSNVCSNPSEITSFTYVNSYDVSECVTRFNFGTSFGISRASTSDGLTEISAKSYHLDYDTSVISKTAIVNYTVYNALSKVADDKYSNVYADFEVYIPEETSNYCKAIFVYPSSYFIIDTIIPATSTSLCFYCTSKYFIALCSDYVYVALNYFI